jgi:hypothetical protein
MQRLIKPSSALAPRGIARRRRPSLVHIGTVPARNLPTLQTKGAYPVPGMQIPPTLQGESTYPAPDRQQELPTRHPAVSAYPGAAPALHPVRSPGLGERASTKPRSASFGPVRPSTPPPAAKLRAVKACYPAGPAGAPPGRGRRAIPAPGLPHISATSAAPRATPQPLKPQLSAPRETAPTSIGAQGGGGALARAARLPAW